MPRKHVYLDDKTYELLNKQSAESGMKESAYIAKLINEAADSEKKSLKDVSDGIEYIKRSQSENGKNITAIMEMLNTFFKAFDVDGNNSEVFFSVEESPHPWTRKSLEIAESKIRMARYSKIK